MSEKMFLFWRLVLAHLIADFPLQTDRIFDIKQRYSWGVLVHASVAGLLGILFAARYLKYPEVFVGLLVLWVAHILIDKGKLYLNRRLQRERLDLFLVDQALHLGLIWLVIGAFDVSERLPIRVAPIAYLYNSDTFVKVLSGYIVVTYGIMLLVYSVKSTLGLEYRLPPMKERLLEFVERGSVMTFALLGGFYYLLIPLSLAPRAVVHLRSGSSTGKLEIFLSLVLSLLVGAGTGQLIR